MLIEFRVENHRSLRDEQVFTMEAGRVGDASDARPRHVAGHTEGLLPVAALYGANASGKSNVLSALAFMRKAVRDSHRRWAPDDGVPREPFAWGPKRDESSLFEVTMLLNDVRHQYGFLASDERFLEEWLFAWPNNKKQVWLERDGDAFKFGENLKGENKLIEEVTRENALFVSAAAQHKHPQLTPIYSWFTSLTVVNLPDWMDLLTNSSRHLGLARLVENERRPSQIADEDWQQPISDRFRTLLKTADIGIVDLRVQRSESKTAPKSSGLPTFEFKHQSDFADAWLPLEKESHGTRTFFEIAVPILQALARGEVLLIDELEASLHPVLAQKIVSQFNDPATNGLNAQLVFSTHDVNLLGTTLGEPALRRDQVWLTEKSTEGATVLYPLTDYKPRKSENLEHGYLQGRYGAIPFLGDFSVIGGE